MPKTVCTVGIVVLLRFSLLSNVHILFFLNVASEEFAMEIEQYYLKLSDFLTS